MNRVKRRTTNLSAKEKAERRLFSKTMANLRVNYGATQKEVADSAGLPYFTTVSQFEASAVKLPFDRVEGYARAMGLDPLRLARTALRVYEPELFKIVFGVSTVESELEELTKSQKL